MAKSESEKGATGQAAGRKRGVPEPFPVFGPPFAHFRDAQEQILRDTENFAKNWFERRHTATRTALETAKEMAAHGPSDPAGAMRALTHWQAHSMERIAQDYREWLELCARCVDHVSRAEAQAGEESVDRMAKSVASTRRMKDDVPV